MSEQPRTFLVSSHGGLHHPNCERAARLKNPKEVSLTPNQIRAAGWTVECCWRWSATRTAPGYVWYEGAVE